MLIFMDDPLVLDSRIRETTKWLGTHLCCRKSGIVPWTREISLHKNNSHDLHRVITHSLVLVIVYSSSDVPKC